MKEGIKEFLALLLFGAAAGIVIGLAIGIAKIVSRMIGG